jgi:hypothetical protein
MDSKVKFFAIVAAVSVVLFAFALVWYTNKPSTPANGQPANVQEAVEETVVTPTEMPAVEVKEEAAAPAKEAAAEEMAVESSMKYELLKGSDIMNGNSGY